MNTRHGFTLVELLVVVAIISLLLVMLVPSFKRARDISKMVVCATNQRTLGVALLGYAGDNGRAYPYASKSFPKESAPYTPQKSGKSECVITWDDLLGGGGYDGRNLSRAVMLERWFQVEDKPKVFAFRANAAYQCPAYGTGPSRRTYGINGGAWGQPPSSAGGWGPQADAVWGISTCYVADNHEYSLSVHLNDVPRPASTIAIGESYVDKLGSNIKEAMVTSPYQQEGMGFSPYTPPFHDNRTKWNYLLCDGHVELLNPDATYGPKSIPGPPDNQQTRSGARGMWTRNPTD